MPFKNGNEAWQNRNKRPSDRYRWTPDEKRDILDDLLDDTLPTAPSEIAPAVSLGTIDRTTAHTFGTMGQYRFGFPRLDLHTMGFNAGDYIVIGAGTGMGKTQIATYIALNNAAQGIPVLFISRELRASEIADRIDTISSKNIPESLYVHPIERLSPPEMVEVIRNFAAEQQGKIVIVDHLHAFCRGKDLTERLGELSEALRELAQDLNITIIALSQLNRQPYKMADGPENYHLKESSYIEEDAYSVMMCWRDGPAFHVKLTKSRHVDIGTLGGRTVTLRSARGFLTDDFQVPVSHDED